MSQTKASLLSGMSAGAAGLLVFLVLHHLWIMPIWFILPLGLMIAALGGLIIGWAYQELLPGLPARPWTILAWAGLVSLTLAPGILLAQLRPPIFTPAGLPNVGLEGGLIIFFRDLLLPAILVGALTGRLIGGTWRAGLAMALAGFVFALGPGHNVPFLGNTPATGKGILLLLTVILSASAILVGGQAVLAGGELYGGKFQGFLQNSDDHT